MGRKEVEKFALQINSAAVLVLEARQEAVESSCCGWEIILFVTPVTTEQSVVILESILRLCCILHTGGDSIHQY